MLQKYFVAKFLVLLIFCAAIFGFLVNLSMKINRNVAFLTDISKSVKAFEGNLSKDMEQTENIISLLEEKLLLNLRKGVNDVSEHITHTKGIDYN